MPQRVRPTRPLLALAAALTLLVGAPGARAAEPAPAADPIDAQGALDLREVTFSQMETRMVLRVVTTGSWDFKDLTQPGRALCIDIAHGEPATPKARLCVTRDENGSAMTSTALDAQGAPGATTPLAAELAKTKGNVLEASFLPVAAGLPVGTVQWSAGSAWRDAGACAAACLDRFPDAGAIDAEVGLLGVPACFGAAARDPRRSCENPELRLTVMPSLSTSADILGSYCDDTERRGILTACFFGAPEKAASGTFAVIGDSHASALKTALQVYAHGRRARGVSVLRASCPMTSGSRPVLPTPLRSRQCVAWNKEVLRWLDRHREVRTVFLSAFAAFRSRTEGKDSFDATVAAYRGTLKALKRRGRRVVVVRDTPKSAPNHIGCIRSALQAKRSPGESCTISRGRSVKRDPLVLAAKGSGAKVVDLTGRFCNRQRCPSVVGGALVHRDETHMTPTFSATLGPFILRELGR